MHTIQLFSSQVQNVYEMKEIDEDFFENN